jgi:hypothetical protein
MPDFPAWQKHVRPIRLNGDETIVPYYRRLDANGLQEQIGIRMRRRGDAWKLAGGEPLGVVTPSPSMN